MDARHVSPGHRPTPHTLPLLFELGYEWDADFQNDDRPFLIDHHGRTIVGMPYAHLHEYPDVWVATRKEITDWVREHPGDLPRRSLEEVLAEFPPPWPTDRREPESRG